MNKINYDSLMNKIIEENGQTKKKLLLHACCAPCASSSVEKIINAFDITLYFYNPNMDGENEYNKRAEEIVKLAKIFNVKYIIENYNSQEFYTAVKGYEKEKEGGLRCPLCFNLRLKKTAEIAKENFFDYFATTLTLSPLKNSELINNIGLDIEKDLDIKYLPTDFKKKGGYLRSIELSKEYGLYRQNYCGCIFSKN